MVPAGYLDESDAPSPVIAYDVTLTNPFARVVQLTRAAHPDLPHHLAQYFFHVANEFNPEHSLGSFHDHRMGLIISVDSSTDATVSLDVQIARDPSAVPTEFDGMQFETTRSVMAASAQSVLALINATTHDDEAEAGR